MKRALIALCVLVAVAGCSSPQTDPWRADEYTVSPSEAKPLDRGFLVMDTPFKCVSSQRRLEELADRRYAPYTIFDAAGRYVRDVPTYSDEFPPKIPLATGRYIVECKVEDDETRRLQIVIASQQTTRITLNDLHAATVKPKKKD